MSEEPSSEFQSLSERLFLLEEEFREMNRTRAALFAEVFDRIDHGIAQNQDMLRQNAEMLHLFKASKEVVSFVKTAGVISMKFSGFIVAISAAVAAVKFFVFGAPKP